MSAPRRTPAEPGRTSTLPAHIANWQLPPGWSWGTEGLTGDERHYQQLTDRSSDQLDRLDAIRVRTAPAALVTNGPA